MHGSDLEGLADRIKPRAASSLLLWLILGFFVAFVLWASIVKLDRTIHAAGRVVPGARLQVVTTLEGGLVAAILAHPGDLVTQGQPIIRLDQTASGAELGSSTVTVAALTAKVARLEAEIGGREPVYPKPTNPADVEQLAIEKALHSARLSDLASLSAAANARVAQAERAVIEAEATYRARLSAKSSAQRQVDMIRPLVERGIEPQISLVQMQNSAAVAAGEADQAAAAVARARSGVREASAMLMQVRQNWRAQAGADLATAQAEMAARRSAMPALADRVRRSLVVAPVSGRVNRVLISTVGSSIAPNQAIAEIVPLKDNLVIEASVSPKDIASVRLNQRARINVSAYESAIYGSMDGRVITISPDATVDERTGESHYTVRIQAEAKTLRDGNGNILPIGAGMTADVNLLGDKRSVMSYILTPITRLSERAARE